MNDLIVKHRVYVDASVSKIFSLLTSGEGWSRWFTQHAHVEPKVGGAIRFEWHNMGPDQVTIKDQGHVTEVVKDQKFAFTWEVGKHPTTVTLSFEPRSNGCVIDVQVTGYKFERDDVEVALNVAASWGETMTLFKFYVERGLVYGFVPPA
ncbi:SRPBCC family protein [Bradyrhizobium neotropicale]|uniref:Activator of Hsp90 ATPase homologue 1/2-like C-terminal domain-containing protein n=1 Tax=Bradyrhizobium neotropicale TaxID=1497615 RepID=A0A176ZC38_9BRAD|nr:SRPBCC domain-containing protein [Bradyrhizobium neotropicale]OAF17403.1 hypothetical protein AXW67_09465 [Bradyrhizobium neotropicale]